MNSNNGGTNQVDKVAEDFLVEALKDDQYVTHQQEKRILKAMQSYAASRSVGYSLEQVKEIAVEFCSWWDAGNRMVKAGFAEWQTTEQGKSLLESSEPVGVQDMPDALEFNNFSDTLKVNAADEDSEIPITIKTPSGNAIYCLTLDEATELGNALLHYVKLEKESNPDESAAQPAVKGDDMENDLKAMLKALFNPKIPIEVSFDKVKAFNDKYQLVKNSKP